MSSGGPQGSGAPAAAAARFLADIWAQTASTSAEVRTQRRYAVIHSGQDWRVLTGSAQIGPFQDHGQALSVATNLTAQALQDGHPAELYAQCEPNDFSLRPLFLPAVARSAE